MANQLAFVNFANWILWRIPSSLYDKYRHSNACHFGPDEYNRTDFWHINFSSSLLQLNIEHLLPLHGCQAFVNWLDESTKLSTVYTDFKVMSLHGNTP